MCSPALVPEVRDHQGNVHHGHLHCLVLAHMELCLLSALGVKGSATWLEAGGQVKESVVQVSSSALPAPLRPHHVPLGWACQLCTYTWADG